MNTDRLPMSIESALQQALGHHQAGRLAPAAAIYLRLLRLAPAHAGALHLLGVVAHQHGQHERASRLIRRAIHVDPLHHSYWQDLGLVCKALRRLDDAVAAQRRALVLAPDIDAVYSNLGNLHAELGGHTDAIACFERALALAPRNPATCYNLGGALCEAGRLDHAARCLEKVLQRHPHYADAIHRLGKVYRLQGRLGASAACCRKTVALDPASSRAFSNLAGIHKIHGDSAAAIALYRRALDIDPGYAAAFSNMLFAMQYADTLPPDALFAEHLRYGERYEEPWRRAWPTHGNRRDPDKRLKVGYVSADFNHHAVAYFVEPVLAHHDATQFEVYCYYNGSRQDQFTARIRAAAAHWIACEAMSDEELAARIGRDGIDVLVDLSGHTAGNRLPVFARKPAPLQVTWLGYFGTSGLRAMDYRLTDSHMDPPAAAEAIHTEDLLRLPHFAPFQPAADSPPVNALPALTNGRLTLAALNNPAKLNRRTIRLWSRILRALPDASLLLCNSGDEETARRILRLFAEAGIGAERMRLQAWLPIRDYLQLHHEIDLALDSFPYNGGTITNHSLWMGVPVVTLAGDRPVARIGAALMARVGLLEFIAASEDEYYECVLRLARDLPRLNRIRLGLRANIAANDFASAAQLTRSIEQAYREIWRQWCRTAPARPAT